MGSLGLLAVCATALVLASCGSEDYREPRCARGDPENRQYNGDGEIRDALGGLKGYPRYRLYNAGPRVAGLPLTGVVSDCQPPAYEPAIYPPDRLPPPISPKVGFTYGTCDPGPGNDARCAPPLQVQNFEVCASSPHSARVPPSALTKRIRGAPYSMPKNALGLALYTGTTTIRISGDRRLVMHAAAQLRSLDGRIGPEDRLPPPAPGALEGQLRCKG